MSSRIVKGFNEFVGAEAAKRAVIRGIIQREFETYGFEIAESPIIEREDFVVGDNANDEAVRDVFRLSDRGKRKLALRFEFTFQLKRLAKNQKLPYKRFQIGSVFRDEAIRKGRSREFTQADADVVGSSMKDEAECLKMMSGIFEKLEMPVKIYFNNRRLINEILVSEGVDEKVRDQAIREIDKLDKLSVKDVADNLKSIGCERVLKIFIELLTGTIMRLMPVSVYGSKYKAILMILLMKILTRRHKRSCIKLASRSQLWENKFFEMEKPESDMINLSQLV